MSPKISIIVPVYNVEKYLRKCIDSILAQTYSNWELLLIDDGSPDQSGAICDEYAAKAPRIRVFHKPNGGVSSARNLGLDHAVGEYVTFVDSDDWLTQDAIEKCVAFMNEYDIIQFGIRFVNSEVGSQYSIYKINEQENLHDYTLKVVGRDAILGVCGGWYKRDLFERFKIRFSTDLISGEDWLVKFELLLQASNIKFINQPLYCYNKYNETSCTHKFRYETHYSNMRAFTRIIELALEKYSYSELSYHISYSKCNLIYDFFVSKLVRGYGLTADEVNNFRRVSNLKCREIIKGSVKTKQFIMLLIYKSIIGNLLLRN